MVEPHWASSKRSSSVAASDMVRALLTVMARSWSRTTIASSGPSSSPQISPSGRMRFGELTASLTYDCWNHLAPRTSA